MAHLLKQNIENLGGSNIKRRKDNVPFDGIKKLKTFIKPLSDVKNIIEEKVNAEQVQKDVSVKSKLEPVIKHDSCNEELFFYSQYEEHYDDIIPKSLQLKENDVSKLVAVFDYLPLKKCLVEHEEFLPVLDFAMTFQDCVNEDLCDVIKGIDSTSFLFDESIYV